MSNFEKVFSELMMDDPDRRAHRIKRYIDDFGHTRAEATIIDDAVLHGVRSCAAAVGAAIDTLSASLAPTCLPAVLHMAATNLSDLNGIVMLIVLGGEQVTPGCDCQACRNINALSRELDIAESAAEAAQGRVH